MFVCVYTQASNKCCGVLCKPTNSSYCWCLTSSPKMAAGTPQPGPRKGGFCRPSRLCPHNPRSPQTPFGVYVCVCVCVCVHSPSQYWGVLNVAKTSAIGSWFLPGSGCGVLESCRVYHYLFIWKYLAIFYQRPRNTCMKPLVFSLCYYHKVHCCLSTD